MRAVFTRPPLAHATHNTPTIAGLLTLKVTANRNNAPVYACCSDKISVAGEIWRIIKVSFDSTTGVKFIPLGSRVAIVSAVKYGATVEFYAVHKC